MNNKANTMTKHKRPKASAKLAEEMIGESLRLAHSIPLDCTILGTYQCVIVARKGKEGWAECEAIQALNGLIGHHQTIIEGVIDSLIDEHAKIQREKFQAMPTPEIKQ